MKVKIVKDLDGLEAIDISVGTELDVVGVKEPNKWYNKKRYIIVVPNTEGVTMSIDAEFVEEVTEKTT